MRQDLLERERQIRRLHQSIEKYTQSPNSKKAIQQAHLELAQAIQYKFTHSAINAAYKFPRTYEEDEDEYSDLPEIVNLNAIDESPSGDISIAEEAAPNAVYTSQNTALPPDRNQMLRRDLSQTRSKLKIKICKKRQIEAPCSSTEKLKRFKTEHHFSTTTCLKSIISKQSHNQTVFQPHETSTNEESAQVNPCSGFKKKIKEIYQQNTKRSHNGHSPYSNNLTLKTQYTPASHKYKSGKQNASLMLFETGKERRRERQTLHPEELAKNKSKPASMKFGGILKPEIKRTGNEEAKNRANNYKSTQNLRSIRLGHSSRQKLTTLRQR